jgi:tetratricopeptide (TPR) repeat protein
MCETVATAAGFYYAGVGEWEKASDLFDQAFAACEELGDQRFWYWCSCNLMAMLFLQGKFRSSLKLAENVYLSSLNHDRLDMEVRGLLGMAGCHIRLGQLDEANRAMASLSDLAGRNGVTSDHKREMQGLQALLRMRQGRQEEAAEAAEQMLAASRGARPFYFGFYMGYAGAAEVYLALWEDEATGDRLTEQASRACKALRKYARVFPVGRVSERLRRGSFYWLSGRPAMAHRMWRASLDMAGRLGMPYDLGLAHYEIGRHLPTDRAERTAHLTNAVAVLTKVGAADAVLRAERALEGR